MHFFFLVNSTEFASSKRNLIESLDFIVLKFCENELILGTYKWSSGKGGNLIFRNSINDFSRFKFNSGDLLHSKFYPRVFLFLKSWLKFQEALKEFGIKLCAICHALKSVISKARGTACNVPCNNYPTSNIFSIYYTYFLFPDFNFHKAIVLLRDYS